MRPALAKFFSIDPDMVEHRTAVVDQLELGLRIVLSFEFLWLVVDGQRGLQSQVPTRRPVGLLLDDGQRVVRRVYRMLEVH